jgi:hypothetical protein
MPADTQDADWESTNHGMWKELLKEKDQNWLGEAKSASLTPLEAKALHVIGLLVQIFNAASHLLRFGENRPYGDYYLHAYLLTCSAIELLARCQDGDSDLLDHPNATLERGFRAVGLDNIHVGLEGYVYNPSKLVALRNMAAHGQGVASVRGQSVPIFLHVELLDNFPVRLAAAYDAYSKEIFKSPDPAARKNLAHSGVEPVHYSPTSGQVFQSPIKYAYERIYGPKGTSAPSGALQNRDWQVYRG